ncbi:hypothetical protein C8J56DRAFT_769006 [Mycena floridula]|nr:hypothetical protein C8J56DRAFT_769006 [Mycena floridula]
MNKPRLLNSRFHARVSIVTQCGDWGFIITRKIALEYGSKHSMAWHTNYPKARAPQLLSEPVLYLRHLLTPYTAAEVAALDRVKWFGAHGRGYNEVQSTQPQTLGYSLADSPVGLLVWIYEKLRNWRDDYPWDDDEGSFFNMVKQSVDCACSPDMDYPVFLLHSKMKLATSTYLKLRKFKQSRLVVECPAPPPTSSLGLRHDQFVLLRYRLLIG